MQFYVNGELKIHICDLNFGHGNLNFEKASKL